MLISFALAIYMLVALLSYDPADAAWSHSGLNQRATNFGGSAGAWLSDLLLYLFGYMALLLPVMLFYNGFILVRAKISSAEDRYQMLAVRWSGFALTLISGCALSSLHFAMDKSMMPLDAGGILGQLAGHNFSLSMGFLGATVLHLALFLSGLTLFTGLSWLAVLDYTGKGTLRAFDWLSDQYYLLKDRRIGSKLRHQREQIFTEHLLKKETRKPVRIEPVVKQLEPSERVLKEQQIPLFNKSDNESFMPSLSLLDNPPPRTQGYSPEALMAMSQQLESKLLDFGIEIQVESVHPGPVITRFEIMPAAGVKVSQISNLAKDLARSLSVIAVRVVEVIPGKSVMGLEIPNEHREIVVLSEILKSKAYDQSHSPLTLALGKDIGGEAVVADLAKMPHLLVAGTTGSGKSVAVNAMLLSLLFKSTPEQVRLIMIDPKMLELSVYDGIPHLLAPVVTDMKDAANGLRWCVAEMERRYKLMSALGVRNIAGYNKKVKDAIAAGEPIKDPLFNREQAMLMNPDAVPEDLDKLPYIVVVVDEFADMMMVVGKKVEELIARLAQKARASGIHLILATQRPSVDVITGLIKSNIPTRIAFQVSSKIDSRTILDQMGAENLLGHGDMLYLPPGTSLPERIHGAFVDDHEVHDVVAEIKKQGKPNYVEGVLQEQTAPVLPGEVGQDSTGADQDALYDEAVAIVTETRKASISYVQRRLKIGYNRAARMIEEMEASGVVTPVQSNGSREVLAPAPPSMD
ncbi:MAG: DNA translocase FtsK 4TM domain-containing protein [Gammaproteobacteria bacterium]|nr:DNA translocase FtsK 4TM domain-containing protein [Gammaproteobacteria bacterium]MBL7001132.1 DNA translocase FtsK 4TM domain-containing protein [Gammaproteobacteria bacterium]